MNQRVGISARQSNIQTLKYVGKFSGVEYSLLFLFMFVEIGFSYWISIATLTSLMFLAKWWKMAVRGLSDLPMFCFVVPFMYASLLIENSRDFTQDALHISREALIYLLMLSILRVGNSNIITVNDEAIRKIIRYLAIFLVAMSLYQSYKYRSHVYFGIPVDYYAQGAATIPDAKALRWSHLRPAATFSEPSYLSFVIISLLMINKSFLKPGGLDYFTTLLLITSGLISQSLGFVIFLVILFIISIYTNKGFKRYRAVFTSFLLVVSIIAAGIGASTAVGSRILHLGTVGGDFSTFVRLFGPLTILPDMLINHPFGVLYTQMLPTLGDYTSTFGVDAEQFTNNAIVNFFFFYGLFGAFIAFFLLKGTDIIFGSYLFMSAMFNGTLFVPDKFAIIMVAYLVYRHHLAKNQLIEQAKTKPNAQIAFSA